MHTKKPALTPIIDLRFLLELTNVDDEEDDRRHRRRLNDQSDQDGPKMQGESEEEDEDAEAVDNFSDPHAVIVQPIFESFDEGGNVSAVVLAIFGWNRLFDNTEVIQNMITVLTDSCGLQYTYQINFVADLMGTGDHHDRSYDYLRRHQEFEPFQEEWEELIHRVEEDDESNCEVRIVLCSSIMLFCRIRKPLTIPQTFL